MTRSSRRSLPPLLLTVLLAAALPACSDSDAAASETSAAAVVTTASATPTAAADPAAVEDTVRAFLLAFNEWDGDGFVSRMSPHLCNDMTGETCDVLSGHATDLFIDQPAIDIRSMETPVIAGDTATVSLTGRVQSGLHQTHLTLVRSGDEWLVDTLELDAAPPLPLPAGVPVVEVAVTEYSFTLDTTALKSGRFALHVTNTGTLPHELVIKRVDANQTLDGPPAENQYAIPVAGMMAIDPGASTNVVLAEQLPPGHYFIFCEVPDEAGDKTHLDHGMSTEFTVTPGN